MYALFHIIFSSAPFTFALLFLSYFFSSFFFFPKYHALHFGWFFLSASFSFISVCALPLCLVNLTHVESSQGKVVGYKGEPWYLRAYPWALGYLGLWLELIKVHPITHTCAGPVGFCSSRLKIKLPFLTIKFC